MVIATFATGYLGIGEYKAQHAEERQAAAEYQAEHAQGGGERLCVTVPVGRYRSAEACAEQPPETDANAQYTEADLHAQQDMAVWAYGVFLASLGTLGLTGVGVILLWLTLSATREAVTETKNATQAMRDGERAWMTPTHNSMSNFLDGMLGEKHIEKGLGLTTHWINSGRSVASKISVHREVRVILVDEPTPHFARPEPREGRAIAGPGAPIQSQIWVLDDRETQLLTSRAAQLFLYVYIAYFDTARQKPAHTEICMASVYIGEREERGVKIPWFDGRTVGDQNTVS